MSVKRHSNRRIEEMIYEVSYKAYFQVKKI